MPAPFTRQSVSERAVARVGTTVQGKYRIDRLLGIGGTAAVYAATHRNGHRVAIKFLLDHLLDDSDIYHLFSREAYVANRVGHPGAVQVLDDDEDVDGCVFLIMPLIEGETLRARWERAHKRLPLAEVGILIADLLDVLGTAHAKGVVHRDIKPENLFVNTAAQIRVLDFGIARRTGAEATTLTMTGRFIGTPAFMPPEQALGNREAIGPHSDLWAVGATMFTLLSGTTVHEAEHTGAQLAAAATQHARSIAMVLPDLAPSIVQFVDKALQFEPCDRWPSAPSMRDALCAALEGALGEKCDVISSRVRETIVTEFGSMADERAAANAQAGERAAQLPDLRSGPSRKTPKIGVADDDAVGPTAVEGSGPVDGSDPRLRDAGASGRHMGVAPSSGRRGVARERQGAAGAEEAAAAKPAVPVDADGAANQGVVAPATRRRRWLSTAATWAAIATLAGLTGAGTMKRCGGAGGTGGTGGMKTAAAAVTSTNTEAQAALEAGLQLWRDASSVAARSKFAEAAQRDPGLAAAHLFFAAASERFDPDARTHFAEAQSLRSRLSTAQTALLDALEPSMEEPPKYALTTRQLEAFTTQFPGDAIGWTVRGAHDIRTRESARILSTADRIPGAVGFWFRARAELHQGDPAAARKSLDSCVAAAPQGGVDCLVTRARMEANEGLCEDASFAAKRLIAIDHGSPSGYVFLARAEFGRTRRTSAVRAILEEKWARVPDGSRDLERQRDEFFLAVLDGEFERAYAALDAWDKIATKSVEATQRAWPFILRIDLDRELGRTEEAQHTARAFVEASQTWMRHDYYDQAIETTRQLYRTGLMDREEFLRQRSRDEQGLVARGGVFATPGVLWYSAYAETVVTAEDARLAVSHEPSATPILDAETREVNVDMELGRTYLYADQLDKSLAALRRATKSCLYWRALDSMPAHALYGDALAKSDHQREACDEYSYVLQRWGREPRSRSARSARESALRLGCPGITGASPASHVRGVSK